MNERHRLSSWVSALSCGKRAGRNALRCVCRRGAHAAAVDLPCTMDTGEGKEIAVDDAPTEAAAAIS